jgi:DNA-binding transcriptional LysR family regulator
MQNRYYYKVNRLQQLKGFCMTVSCGSVTKAARMMSISPSSVSKQISSLENELNLTLFSLNGKKISLTFEGELFYNKIAPFIEISDGLFKNFSTFAKEAKQTIKIATHVALSSKVLPPIIDRFTELYPKCRIVIRNTNKVEGLKALNSCEVDLLFFQLHERDIEENLQPLTTFTYKVYEEVIILGKDNPLALKDNITIRDLQSMNFLVLKDNVAVSDFKLFANSNKLTSKIEIESGTWETLVALVLNSSNCVTMLDRFYVENIPNIVIKKNNFFTTDISYQFCILQNNSKKILNDFINIAKSFC